MKEAFFYRLDKDSVRCSLCPSNCLIKNGCSGKCGTRKNVDGTLYALNFFKAVTMNVDPIEKKPLYHFMPGTEILSIASSGCNLSCNFCQNYGISQLFREDPLFTIQEIFERIKKNDSIGVAYTYTEPTIWYETILELSKAVKERGLYNVLVTNGYINKKPLVDMLTEIDAINLDIKSTSNDFYERICGGSVLTVLENAVLMKKRIHLEITNLVIPTLNDSDDNITKLATFISENLGRETPLHLSRYFPNYKLDLPATPLETLLNAREIALDFLDYVYIGNVAGDNFTDTHCPNCETILIKRNYMQTEFTENLVSKSNGTFCGVCREKLSGFTMNR